VLQIIENPVLEATKQDNRSVVLGFIQTPIVHYLISSKERKMIQLEFDQRKAYGDVIFNHDITYEDYMSVPVIRWCSEHIGLLRWPIRPGEQVSGEGWEIYADWSKWMAAKYRDIPPRTVLILHEEVDQKLITEFWMRFGQ
jgi:hypothetical protein